MTTPVVYLKDLANCDKWLYDMAEAVDKRERPKNASTEDKLDKGNNWLSPREQQRLEQEIREHFTFSDPYASKYAIEEKVSNAMDQLYSNVPGWEGFKQRVRYAAGTLFPGLVDKFSGVASK